MEFKSYKQILNNKNDNEKVKNLVPYCHNALGTTKKKCPFTLVKGATHVDIAPTKVKLAFTLAEVLITLGIIGVVAAMTIPTLMSNYRKKQLETQIKANYSLVQQAIKFAEYDDVSYDMAIQDGSDASIQEWYDSFLSKHLKAERFCSNAKSGCWHKKGIVKDLLGNAPRYEYDNGIGGNIVNFKLANGAFFNVDGNTAEDMKSFGIDSTSDGLTFYFDANGDKKPNQFGKDIYIMVWTDKGLVPAGYNRTKAEVNANCLRGDGYFCLQKVISEGWQISDEVWKRH